MNTAQGNSPMKKKSFRIPRVIAVSAALALACATGAATATSAAAATPVSHVAPQAGGGGGGGDEGCSIQGLLNLINFCQD